MKNLLLGSCLAVGLLALAPGAQADEILAFGQVGTLNSVTATATGGTSTTLVATNVASNITALFGGGTPSAFFDLNAHSIGAASTLGNGFQQNFAGTFSLTSLAGGAGINYLSGMFTDLAFGINTILLVGSSDPPDAITFTSSVIPAAELGQPRGIALSLSNFNPSVGLDGTTLSSGTASITGTFDSAAAAVPEPFSMAMIGTGMIGLGMVKRRRSV